MTSETAGEAARRAARDERLGYANGLMMAIGAALAFAVARAGIVGGLAPEDLVLMRFGVAGLLLLPFLLRWGLCDLAGIGWRRGLALLLFGGPLFALLQIGGYRFAPLAHGAVIAPSTVTILSTIGAAWLLGERLTRAHLAGAALVLVGILALGGEGLVTGGGRAWIGDLLFFASSVLWAGFTLLLRHWRLEALRATAVVSVLSCAVTVPAYLALQGFDHLAALPAGALALQGLVQGVVQGALTLIAYSRAVALLGVSRAVLFPAVVPAIAVLLGIPIVGEWPNAAQIAGLVLVTIGLLTAVGLFRRRPA
ncbi:DMT family transporter [Desertibaculum subflavum]|uniref:DMT family transporter n=1 Tax=Desertibaculum subflavum TaxID=2268458 RepID=UPI000E65FD66